MYKEIWKPIEDYELSYECSNYGNIRSLTRKNNKNRIVYGQNLKPFLSPRGYFLIDLSKNGVGVTFSVHRIICKTFNINLNNLKIINHIDGNKLNNHYLNLEWVSQQENICHFIKNKKTSSKFIGVGFNKYANKWKARTTLNKKAIHIGYYNTEEEAKQAYITFEKENNIINKYS